MQLFLATYAFDEAQLASANPVVGGTTPLYEAMIESDLKVQAHVADPMADDELEVLIRALNRSGAIFELFPISCKDLRRLILRLHQTEGSFVPAKETD